MGRIKGPITIKGFSSQEFMKTQAILAAKTGNVKLPFTATGFSCTKLPSEVSLEGIEFAKGFDPKNPKLILKGGPKPKPVEPVAEPELVPEPVLGASSEPELFPDIDSLIEIKGVGAKSVGVLKKLYKSMDALKEALEKDDSKLYKNLKDNVVDLLRNELIGD